jgi:Cu(I)-responsive transcriptional regulator
MKIGQTSKLSGVATKTIRYYEGIGLLSPAPRQANGYRDYSDSDVATLQFIGRARNLGFTLKDTENLISLWQDQHRASSDVKKMAMDHIRDIELRIEELSEVRDTLVDLTEKCHGDDRPDCPILQGLSRKRENGLKH